MARNRDIDKWLKKVRKGLDDATAAHVIKTQGKLAKNAPKDSGRLASSWFVSQGRQGVDETRPDDWAAPGARRVEVRQPDYKITVESDHTISNNLPYARRTAFDPVYGKGGAGGGAWFTNIVNSQARNYEQAIKRHMPK